MASGEKYRFIDHTADLGMEVYGEDRTRLFINAAAGFYRLVLREGYAAKGEDQRQIKITGRDHAELLREFLSELNYLLITEQFIGWLVEDATLTDTSFSASLCGKTYERSNPAEFEIKAVTYHALRIEEDQQRGWKATIIFDV